MESVTFISNLKKYLLLEIDCASHLQTLIQDEQEALASLDDKLIILNSERKQQLIDSLQDATQGRVDLMMQQGLKANHEGVVSCLEIAYFDSELEDMFNQLNTLATSCARENKTAGQLIHRRSSFLTRAIDNLVQMQPANGGLYQANGKTTSFNSARHLVST